MSIFSPITFKLEQKKEKLLTVIQRVFSHGRTKVLIFLVPFSCSPQPLYISPVYGCGW